MRTPINQLEKILDDMCIEFDGYYRYEKNNDKSIIIKVRSNNLITIFLREPIKDLYIIWLEGTDCPSDEIINFIKLEDLENNLRLLLINNICNK